MGILSRRRRGMMGWMWIRVVARAVMGRRIRIRGRRGRKRRTKKRRRNKIKINRNVLGMMSSRSLLLWMLMKMK